MILAFGALGPDAAEAIPALVNILRGSKSSSERRELVKSLAAIGLEAVPELIVLGSENTDNCSRYRDQSKSALDALEDITGEEYDLSKWGKDMDGVCKDILEFLDHCQAFYDEHKK